MGSRIPPDGGSFSRRDLLKVAGAAAATSLAGCASTDGTGTTADGAAYVYGYGGGRVTGTTATLAAANVTAASVSLPAPVGRWTLDESNGPTLHDVAGGHDATVVGDPVLGHPGVRGAGCMGCRQRDGNYARVAHADALDPSAELSFGGWFRTDSGDTEQTVLQKATYHMRGTGYALDVQANRGLRACVGVASGRAFVNPWDDFATHDGAWHHLFATWDGDVLVLYYDGNEVGRDASQSGPVAGDDSPLYLGHGHNAWTESYDLSGSIDDVRVYDVALDADAVAALYDGTTTTGTTTTSAPTTTTTTPTTTTTAPTTTTTAPTTTTTTPATTTTSRQTTTTTPATTTTTPTTTTTTPATTTTTPTTTTTTPATTTTTPTTTTTTPTTTTTTPTTTTTSRQTTTTTATSSGEQYGEQTYGAHGYGGVSGSP